MSEAISTPSDVPIGDSTETTTEQSVDSENLDGLSEDDLSAELDDDLSDEDDEDSREPQSEQEQIEEEIKRLKKLKLKFNGKEYEEELPFEIPEDQQEWMARQLQLAKLGQTKSQDYSTLESQVKEFYNELVNNPRKVLSDPRLNIDLKQLAAEVLQQELEDSQKTPEQLEKEKLEKRLAELEEERKREKEEMESREFERIVEQKFAHYDAQMTTALENSDLPKSPYVVKKMADLMILGVENNLPIEPQDIVPLVRSELINDVKDMFGVMPPEVIAEIMGEGYDKVRKYKLREKRKKGKAVNAGNAKKTTDVGKVTETNSEKPQQKMSIKEFFGV